MTYLSKNKSLILFFVLLFCQVHCNHPTKEVNQYTISQPELFDKIKGGLTGQLIGNLNGLPYEFKFVDKPGEIQKITPDLSEGARTDDDTDIEWVHIHYMDKYNTLQLPYDSIEKYWKKHINYHIWASNRTARRLLSIGMPMPETGKQVYNPLAKVNLGGQFCCEAYGLISPGMCKSAEETGLHYTRVIVDGQSQQCTQFFTAMIAEAFFNKDYKSILENAIQGINENSKLYAAVQNVKKWHKQHPENWKATRDSIKAKYHTLNNKLPINNYGVNASAIVAAFLYGQGDFIKTMTLSLNFGWDNDCNAATVGTILGVMHGYKWIKQQGWPIKDRYWNTTRPGMPKDETITSYAEKLTRLAEVNILKNAGEKYTKNDTVYFKIHYQKPYPFELKISSPEKERKQLRNKIQQNLITGQNKGLPVFQALCLGLKDEIKQHHTEDWQKGVDELKNNINFLHTYHHLPDIIAKDIKNKLNQEGIVFVPPDPTLDGAVTFKLDNYQDAAQVYLGTDYNGWQAWKLPLAKQNGKWICRLNMEPGKYEYKFLIKDSNGNQKYIFDPENPVKEKNHNGYENSILVVK